MIRILLAAGGEGGLDFKLVLRTKIMRMFANYPKNFAED